MAERQRDQKRAVAAANAAAAAEASRQKSVLIAKGEAEGTLARMQAEAQGVRSQLDSKAQGYKALVEACNSDTQLTAALLLIEKLTELTRIQAEAVRNLPIEKMIVWDAPRKRNAKRICGNT